MQLFDDNLIFGQVLTQVATQTWNVICRFYARISHKLLTFSDKVFDYFCLVYSTEELTFSTGSANGFSFDKSFGEAKCFPDFVDTGV